MEPQKISIKFCKPKVFKLSTYIFEIIKILTLQKSTNYVGNK